jgi:hypothetical protein
MSREGLGRVRLRVNASGGGPLALFLDATEAYGRAVTQGIRMRGRGRRCALALLALSFLLQAWIPSGYMLGRAEAGAPLLIPCPGTQVSAQHQSAHHAGHHPKGTADSAPCPYAALSAPGLLAAPPAFLPEPALLVPAAAAWPDPLLAPFQLPASHPPATGPPARR